MFDCPGCGRRIEDPSKGWCSGCGVHLRWKPQGGLSSNDKVRLFFGNIFLSPLLGVILYFVWKDEKAQKASDVCSVTILAFVGTLLLVFVLALFGSN